jgi:6-phosphofructokinase 1
MAFHFVTHAIDGLLEGKKSTVVCHNAGGFSYKEIHEVAFKQYQISPTLMKLGKEYGHI